MPPIPVHLDDPINANTASKADGTTPQTSSDPAPTRTSAVSANTSSFSSPPPPQPGAVPSIPAPTAALTSITTSASNDPSQPQPGARPSAYSTTTAAILGYPTPTQPPPQASIPPPQASSQYTKSTIADGAAGAGRAYPTPTTLNMGPAAPAASPAEIGAGVGVASMAHPPGYTQNEAAFRHVPNPQETGSGPLLGGLGGGNAGGGLGGAGTGPGDGEGTVVGNVMKGLESAGEQLRKGEEAVWKWVGGKSR